VSNYQRLISKGLSKTIEASFMIDGLRTGIWKRSLRNISQEPCLHVVMRHNTNLDRQANLRSHTKVCPVLVTHTNRLRGLDCIASLRPISRTLYIHCVAAHKGLSGYKAPSSLRKFPILRLQRNYSGQTACQDKVFHMSLTSSTFYWRHVSPCRSVRTFFDIMDLYKAP
jgi:hypothetical protein